MRIAYGKDQKLCIVVAALSFQVSAAIAQHASDNPVTAAEDAYGLTLGLESVGIYTSGLVRGFNPQTAGNVRLDGLYFDQQGGLTNRVVEGSTIRVGVSEIDYDFPAPTGIVDYNLRHLGGDTPGATIIANVGSYEAKGVSIDGTLPLMSNSLVLPMGVSTQLSTQTSGGAHPGYTSRVTSVGATPQWSPNEQITVRALVDWQATSAAKTFPLFFTAGNFLPPPIPKGYVGQNWAEGSNETLNLGGLISARLTERWSLKAGVFRSTNENPKSFADLYTDVEPNSSSEHLVAGYPDQNTASNSGEVRLTGAFTTDGWRQRLIFMARGRDTRARYGGGDVVDAGSAALGALLEVPKPDFMYSALTNDHTVLWSVGSAYRVDWRDRGEFELGVQDENYRETVTVPGAPESAVTAHPLRFYGNAAILLTRQLTLYTGYTQGLENSGVAPTSAANSGTVFPASLTWQFDSGLRYSLTPKLKIIAGVFELQKPYFNLDMRNVDRDLGVQQAKGIELSVSGELTQGLHVNVGVLDGRVSIVGQNLAADGVGPVAVGQPRLMFVANTNYVFPWWPSASMDLAATHFGSAPASVDNGIYSPASTQVNLGGRYKFTAFGKTSSLRIQIQNVLAANEWATQFTPGFFRSPAPRTVFAYITTDLL